MLWDRLSSLWWLDEAGLCLDRGGTDRRESLSHSMTEAYTAVLNARGCDRAQGERYAV